MPATKMTTGMAISAAQIVQYDHKIASMTFTAKSFQASPRSAL